MKLKKYTFRTPLCGSIDCEELLLDTDRIELSPENMGRLYDAGDELLLFLSENMEDLVSHVPEELKDTVLRAEFGDFAMLGGKMWMMTYIWTEHSLTEEGTQKVRDWIEGQMSDGWGESLEQEAWKCEYVRRPSLYFDYRSLDFEEDEERVEVSYYVHPWTSDFDFFVYLDEVEEVDEDLQYEVVAAVSLPFHHREVIKFSSDFGLRLFMKDIGQGNEIVEQILDKGPDGDKFVYIVRDLQEANGVEVLPMWIIENYTFCRLYEVSENQEIVSTEMTITKAVLEMLK